MKFTQGSRVACYCTRYGRKTGVVQSINEFKEEILVKWDVPDRLDDWNQYSNWYHNKQCRKLIPKKKK